MKRAADVFCYLQSTIIVLPLKTLLYNLYRIEKGSYMQCTNRQFFACIIFMGMSSFLSL